MSAKQQYEFFKFAYERESARHKDLIDRAKLYFTIWSAIVGVLFTASVSNGKLQLQLKTINFRFDNDILFVSLICSIAAMGVAIFLCVMALSIRNYEGLTDLRKALNMAGGDKAEEIFYMRRIADFVVASERNKKQNDKIARHLRLSLWLGLLGFLAFLGLAGL